MCNKIDKDLQSSSWSKRTYWQIIKLEKKIEDQDTRLCLDRLFSLVLYLNLCIT